MDIILAVFSFILGAILASFAGVVIFRVPNNMSIVKPDSFCPNCKHHIRWFDNIPIVSYIVLGGKCRYCKNKIGAQSLVFELLGGFMFLLSFLTFGLSWELAFVLPLAFLFIIIAGIDYNTHYIYNFTQIIYFVVALGYVLYKIFVLNQDWLLYLIGAIVGFVFFELIRVLGKLIMKVECLGFGDVILMTISGMLLGWQALLIAVLVGSFVGSVVELSLIGLKKKDRHSEIAFGPYLLLGTFVAIIFAPTILSWYLGLVM